MHVLFPKKHFFVSMFEIPNPWFSEPRPSSDYVYYFHSLSRSTGINFLLLYSSKLYKIGWNKLFPYIKTDIMYLKLEHSLKKLSTRMIWD